MQSSQIERHTEAWEQQATEAAGLGEHEAWLLAELQIARDRAALAARLVLELNSRLETASAYRQQLNDQLAASMGEAENLMAKRQANQEAWDQQRAALRVELAASQKNNWELEARLAQQAQAETALRQQFQDLAETLALERLQHSALETRLAQTRADATQRQEAAENLACSAQAHLAALTEENARLAAEVQRLQQELAGQEHGLRRLRAEIETARMSRAGLPAQQAPAEDERAQPEPHSAALAVSTEEPTGRAAPASRLDLTAGNVIATDVCPHLGLKADPDTRHGFASAINRCYARGAGLEVIQTQQTNYCLGENHRQCPIFTGAITAPKAPIDIEASTARRTRRLKLWGESK